ncbi:hypothetical protein [Mycobacterium asiaticum]|uniref:Uncharacterized protein n=1 Tax=Mycobacterium asiaticum TaxID=1790 RepID=A0A1A3MXN0_MYCAS|nr:hypothetical protein [Mycobacterium asiaticum]OBK13559.1 hypothetical protein A5636_09350 [Mycobacterium asiaticum]
MSIAVVVILVLAAVLGLTVAVVAIVGRSQKRALNRDNQVMPGRATRAPQSWAVSHEPEARLHRRLRDAMAALRGADSVDTGSTIVLRADLEQTVLDLDDHLVAVSQLSTVHKGELLKSITTTVQCIENAVARYAAAATRPDTSALEADLAAVQRQLDVTAELQRRLPPQ